MADNYMPVLGDMDVCLGSVRPELDCFFKCGYRVLGSIAVSTAVCNNFWLIQHFSPLENF